MGKYHVYLKSPQGYASVVSGDYGLEADTAFEAGQTALGPDVDAGTLIVVVDAEDTRHEFAPTLWVFKAAVPAPTPITLLHETEH